METQELTKTATNTAVAIPANLQVLMQTAPEILTTNRTRVQRANDAGQALLEKMNAGMNEITYNQGMEFIAKIRKTIAVMNENRKPITQIIGEISKQFTSLEADLDVKGKGTIPAKIQGKLDEFAADLARKKADEERLAALRIAKEKARIEVKADVEIKLNEYFAKYLKDSIDSLNRYWAGVTLQTFDEVSTEIMNLDMSFEENAFGLFTYSNQNIHLMPGEVLEIKKAAMASKIPEFQKKFVELYNHRRQEIIDLFNSKHAELLEIENANAQEAERLKKIAEERERAAEADALRKSQELLHKANAEVEVTKSTETVNSLFSESMSVAAPAVKIKEQIAINVNGPAGWMALLAFYFEKEAKGLTPEQLEKKFGFARKFAESYFDKHGEEINSPFLTYVKTAKAK
ncbi:MAG: hypothetical protein K0B15_07280 [Lentimicrobium sp.]|nr:hypothetical protein [Lentimicrobium sp.]